MGQIVFQATLGGQTALVGQNTASSFSLNLPLATDTLVGKATTDTLTNKTINGSSNTLSNIGNSALTNSSLTIGSTAISLGATATTVTGLTLASPTITSSGLTFSNGSIQNSAGKVIQVVNATYGTQVSSTTTGYIDTGLTATITPLFSTSKILILVSQNGCWKTSANTGNAHDIKLVGGNTGSPLFSGALSETDSAINNSVTASLCYLDSPATTSATTYKTQFQSRNNTATVYVQYAGISISYITLMEIAA